jgi:flavin reductase (DIM6/NTAB) family NADH-FMN oxidoreductase RutF
MPIGEAAFRKTLGRFPSGVTVVSTHDALGRPFALTVSAFCSVSLRPPLILVSIENRSDAHRGLRESGAFGVSILAASQESLSRRFATKGRAKLKGGGLEPGETGVLLVSGALAHLECTVAASYRAGDHTIYLGRVRRLTARSGAPLVHHAGRYRRLAPQQAGASHRGTGASSRNRV